MVVHKTRRRSRRSKIQHHHFLLRVETQKCPTADSRDEIRDLITTIVREVNMKLLSPPQVFYVRDPVYNEGLTALAPISTSHLSFHFWLRPERAILKNHDSVCLLQFDLYTCGNLTLYQIQKILHHLTRFAPTHVNATLLNRKWSLTLERQLVWDAATHAKSFSQWADSVSAM